MSLCICRHANVDIMVYLNENDLDTILKQNLRQCY